MAKDNRKRVKQTLLALFLGVSLLLIAATWVEGLQEGDAPAGYFQDAVPTYEITVTPAPGRTRGHGQGQDGGAGHDEHGDATPVPIPTDDATPTRNVAGEEM